MHEYTNTLACTHTHTHTLACTHTHAPITQTWIFIAEKKISRGAADTHLH